MAKTYLFYDLETSGLSAPFDQILEFAAIRTTEELEELSRHYFKVALRPDIVPSPQALMTHRIGLDVSEDVWTEDQVVYKIHELFNQPDTITCGYNTLGFDDEFMRFAFYRNLLNPYTHQYANGCGRLDIYPITALFYSFVPEALEWPVKDGKQTLKLEHINTANRLVTGGQAHHAMTDVEVTIALAKRLATYSEAWDYAVGYFDKQTDSKRMAHLSDGQDAADDRKWCIMVNGRFGMQRAFQAAVFPLGSHDHYKNQTLWLRLDQCDFSSDKPEDMQDTHSWVVRKKLGEPGLLLPMEKMQSQVFTSNRLSMVTSNLAWIKENPDFFKALSHYHREYTYPAVDNIDIDAALYESGFRSKEEEQLCDMYRVSPPMGKLKLLSSFQNKGLLDLAVRNIWRYEQADLPKVYLPYITAYQQAINPHQPEKALCDYRGHKRLTPTVAMSEISRIRSEDTLDNEQKELLNALQAYLMKHFTF